MKTNNTIIYSQIQAIQPTDNMKSKQKDFNKKRNQGVAIILTGVALGAAVHVSIGVIMVVIGFMRIPHIASPVDAERRWVEKRWNDDLHTNLDRNYWNYQMCNRDFSDTSSSTYGFDKH